MTTTDKTVLDALQTHAREYFQQLCDFLKQNGVTLESGQYSARDLCSGRTPWNKSLRPKCETSNNTIEISADNFKCSFLLMNVFEILSNWEAITKAGSSKAVFEVGGVEIQKLKVLSTDTTPLGTYKTKTVTLRRLVGNWWIGTKYDRFKKTRLYYQAGEVLFYTSKEFYNCEIDDESAVNFCNRYDSKILDLVVGASVNTDMELQPYFAEVAKRIGIMPDSDKQAAITAEIEQRKAEEEERERLRIEEAQEEAQRREKEMAELQAEEERQIKARRIATVKKFLAGKMVNLDEFELIAAVVHYQFNPRTLGTLRKRVAYIEIPDTGKIRIYGTQRRAGLDGSFAAIREVYELAKGVQMEDPRPTSGTPDTPTASDSSCTPDTPGTSPTKEAPNIIQPPQPPETSEAGNCATPTEKRRQTAPTEPTSAIPIPCAPIPCAPIPRALSFARVPIWSARVPIHHAHTRAPSVWSVWGRGHPARAALYAVCHGVSPPARYTPI